MEEEKIKFSTNKDVFYNPNMTFCRSMSSLAVGAIDETSKTNETHVGLDVVDAFCASGIRGIRYAKENQNVSSLTFIDIDQKAISLAKKNAKSNKLKSDAKKGNISKLAFEYTADFLEIDPFGTPSPYLLDSFRFFNPKKSAYLSVTATDVAVLCGGKTAPCMKNYHAKPMNNEFTHETGLRIMIKRIAEVAAEFNMGIEPLVSFSDRHYLKSVLRVKRSADLAYESLKQLGYVFHCHKCGFRGHSQFPEISCSNCGSKNDFAGQLWLGEIHNRKFVNKMQGLNKARDYTHKKEIDKMLTLLSGEVGMPPYYYDLHKCSQIKGSISMPKMIEVIDSLEQQGYQTVRTHFSKISIKTTAPYKKILGGL
ncbi:tRNA (guanine(10)-N(2))-dimethyltransferase [Candidatus Micrarchaeota archaeon]|nr:tRNA (guanine(10)-N(2))-dimethyltransferase [Candidatus Micrarchaeota archaeon]MBU1165398.1 tRNA (guanine(10)-N(2))-dimethyltransferase [Candidatus Micrarchaeota archaeon]MBU1887057.1 tRNA (guanine(10)-N(2))-dimethyltransferase [Candidatus Micrarchaeota archaeon]